jgi:lysozyme
MTILAQQFEGCVLNAYQDQGGVWTIGWGHTGKEVYAGLVWTQDQADEALQHDWVAAQNLLALYSPGLTNGPQDALTDFVFNLGVGAYRTSTLCQLVNAQDFASAAIEILKWDHVHGVVIPGLLTRRQAEAALLN